MAEELVRVLLVDDDEDDYVLTRDLLAEAAGNRFDLEWVATYEAALETMRRAQYHVYLVDYRLGEQNGLELLCAAIASGCTAPIIVLTGQGDHTVDIAAMQAGAADYVDKGQLSAQLLERSIRHAIERKEAEEALQESEARYRAIVEDQTELICRFLSDGTLTFVNEAYCRCVGKKQKELIGQSFVLFISEEDRGFVKEQFASLSPEHPVLTHEHRILMPNGEMGWQQWTIRAIYDEQGHLIEYQAVGRDITERKRAEETLRRRNRELGLLNRVGQELATTLDLRQVIEQVLQATTEIVSSAGASVWLWDEEEDEEKKDRLVCRAVSHDGQNRTPVNMYLAPGQGVAGWTVQHEESVIVASVQDDPRFFRGTDEQTGFRTTSLIAVPLRVRGAVIGVLEVVNKQHGVFDTDDLALVETLAAAAAVAIDNAGLVEALRQHTTELQTSNEDLDAFAHTAAHDLKGPLGYMVGFAQVLEQDYAILSDEDRRRSLHTIAQSGRKMSNIVDELLLMAGLRAMEVEMGPLDMGRTVVEALQRLAYMIEKRQAEITLPESWPVALGYEPWVEEIWVNYLSNALKYGGRPPRLELGYSIADWPSPGEKSAIQNLKSEIIRFWVRDNGPGLTPKEQVRLFKPFTRLDQVRAKGHGLGLSIARRIVEKMGGQVGVESEVGHGSVFSFTLACAAGRETRKMQYAWEY